MSVARVCFVMAAFAAIAVTAVHLRGEQTRGAAELAKLDAEWVSLRRQWWDVQVDAAGLRTPKRIRARVQDLQADLIPPDVSPMDHSTVRLASDELE